MRAVAATPHRGVIRPHDLLMHGDHPRALVLEDIDGMALSTWLERHKPTVAEVLGIAQQAAEALGHLHAARVIHKDVNPHNIVYNPRTGRVQLIDLGIASRLQREWHVGESLQTLEGTPRYMSPEQTGRMNRAVDYRTDGYSLGATLYELLTGQPPFDLDDSLELVHAILSKRPPRIDELAPHVPSALCRVVEKMMAKAVEERYQSSYGLLRDLTACAELTAIGEGVGDPFVAGGFDCSERFEVSQKLYGRAESLEALLAAFRRASEGYSNLVLVSGASGVGKSALVQAVQPTFIEHRAIFISGKFDQMQRHVPFNAFNQAVSQLIHRIIGGDPGAIAAWRTRLQKALGGIGQALVDIAPAVELLVGAQEPLPTLPLPETQNRVLVVLRRFVLALCEQQPLVLFLDDLQWADSGTLRLLEDLLTADAPGARLLLICAHRPAADGTEGGDLATALLRLGNFGKPTRIALQPLSRAELEALVGDSLRAQDAQHLAEVVFEKTGGNAFFVTEFLKHLASRDLLRHDYTLGRWVWDLSRIRVLDATENVVGLLIRAVRELPADAQRLASFASCLGDRFYLGKLRAILRLSIDGLQARLWPLLEAGMLVPQESGSHLGDGTVVQFAHDKVRQACYDMASTEQALDDGLQIGRFLLGDGVEPPATEALFELLEHFNRAEARISSSAERARLGKLNVAAAQEAKRATAYGPARSYLLAARAFARGLATDPAEDRFIALELAECEYLLGEHAQSTRRLEELLESGTDAIERAEICARRVNLLFASGQEREAVRVGLLGLRDLGIFLPEDPSELRIAPLIVPLYLQLKSTDVRGIARRPWATDKRVLATMELLGSLTFVTMAGANNNLYALIGLHLLRLTLKHGVSRFSTVAFTISVMLFGNAFRDIPLMADLSQASFTLLSERGVKIGPAMTHLGDLLCVQHLSHSLMDLMAYDRLVYETGMQHGDFVGVSLGGIAGSNSRLWTSIDACMAWTDELRMALRNAPKLFMGINVVRQAALCLQGRTKGATSLADADYDEDAMVPQYNQAELMTYGGAKNLLALIMRDFDAALQAVEVLEGVALRKRTTVICHAAHANIIMALTLTQLARARGSTRIPHASTFRFCRRNIAWLARRGPSIYEPVSELLDAECAVIAGDDVRALRLYTRALQELERVAPSSILALGTEAAARFYVERGLADAGNALMLRAHQVYERWGVETKVAALEAEFPHLVAGPAERRTTRDIPSPTLTKTGTVNTAMEGEASLDFVTVIRAAQALSHEHSVDALVEKIMETMVSAAGADHGAMLVLDGAQALLQAQHRPGEGGVCRTPPVAADRSDVPLRLVNYVTRIKQPLVLNAEDQSSLWDDPYFSGARPKAILCLPVLQQGAVKAVVYLENRAVSRAFTQSRADVLEILASQAAISLENASLYTTLENKVQERTRQVRDMQAKVVSLEKAATTTQMAGGFAHEMRNALFAATALLNKAMGDEGEDGGLCIVTQQRLEELYELGQAGIEPGVLPAFNRALSDIVDNEGVLMEILAEVRASASRALRITQQILDYAKVGEVVASDEAISVTAVLGRVMRELALSFEEAHIHVSCEAPTDVPVAMSEAHLHSVLSNLLINARDALRDLPETQPRSIVVQVRAEGDAVTVQVRDTGKGISEAARAKIFQPFYSTKGAQGTGLGLAMSKKLVEIYAGRIAFESEVGRGTKFILQLPRPGP
ncbi:MAG TPA: AAA family ATPase [Myxococcota bacterium]|nr:AAA family ATPase [Myxococcota bacterium]